MSAGTVRKLSEEMRAPGEGRSVASSPDTTSLGGGESTV